MNAAMERERDIEALLAFIESRHFVPHAWGRDANDCAGFALAAAEAQTGEKRAQRIRWNNRAEALRVISRFGGLEAAFDRYFQRIEPIQAMRGDIAGVPADAFGIHPMVVEGALLVSPGEDGNRRAPRSAMVCAWSATLPQPKRTKAAK